MQSSRGSCPTSVLSVLWNFTKFLVGKDGTVLKRYGSATKPEKIAADIEKALAS